MHFSKLFAGAAAIAVASATYSGWNYDAHADFQTEFTRAKQLANGKFNSARLYTMIQPDTTDTPTTAIQAAINTKTTLLLGMWASAGQADMTNEINALKAAISQYGTAFTNLIAGISVGSEDLYRVSPTGIKNNSGAGATPSQLVSYIQQVRAAIKGTAASAAKVGHVDTYTAWINGSNSAVINNVDFLGVDAYPYYQDVSIGDANATFYSAYNQAVAVAKGKPVWVTETGWPVSGPTAGSSVPSVANAETYWQDVACTLNGKTSVWWYILSDQGSSPSFGVLGSSLSAPPLYSLKCKNGNSA